jgi:hypothetical protein
MTVASAQGSWEPVSYDARRARRFRGRRNGLPVRPYVYRGSGGSVELDRLWKLTRPRCGRPLRGGPGMCWLPEGHAITCGTGRGIRVAAP